MRRTAYRRAQRRKYRELEFHAKPTHHVIWEKVFLKSRAGVEHISYEPVILKIVL